MRTTLLIVLSLAFAVRAVEEPAPTQAPWQGDPVNGWTRAPASVGYRTDAEAEVKELAEKIARRLGVAATAAEKNPGACIWLEINGYKPGFVVAIYEKRTFITASDTDELGKAIEQLLGALNSKFELPLGLLTNYPLAHGKRTASRFPDNIHAILSEPDELEIISLETDGEVHSEGFHNYKVLGRAPVPAGERKTVFNALDKSLFKDKYHHGCFSPRHGLRAVKNGKTAEIVICFECGNTRGFGDEKAFLRFDKSAEPVLDKVLKDANVPLARKSSHAGDREYAKPFPAMGYCTDDGPEVKALVDKLVEKFGQFAFFPHSAAARNPVCCIWLEINPGLQSSYFIVHQPGGSIIVASDKEQLAQAVNAFIGNANGNLEVPVGIITNIRTEK